MSYKDDCHINQFPFYTPIHVCINQEYRHIWMMAAAVTSVLKVFAKENIKKEDESALILLMSSVDVSTLA
jgi:hypothetical protein